jgi:hypothetical protein
VAGRLLVTKAEVSHAFSLSEAGQVSYRNSGYAIDHVEPVKLQRVHHKVESIGDG